MSVLTMSSFQLFVWMNRPNNSLKSSNIGQPMEHASKIRTGSPARYIRHGVSEIYMAFELLAGQRFVEVKEDHKAITWVGVIADLLDGPYIKCVKMTVVGDNLTGPLLRCP